MEKHNYIKRWASEHNIILPWDAYPLSLFVNRLFLPSPLSVINNLIASARTPEMYTDVWITFKRTVIGLSLGTVVGVEAGIRVSLAFALIVELVAEMFLGSQNGLGHRIFAASSILAMEEVYTGILLIGILGYTLNSLMLFAERKIIHWSGQGV